MKVKSRRDADILREWLSEKSFGYAAEANGVVTHFNKEGRPGWNSRGERFHPWPGNQPGEG
jgi:hypothetical protein